MPRKKPSRGEVLERSLALPLLLLERKHTLSELATLLNVSKKTIRRYIDALEQARFPVFEETRDRERVYGVRNDYKFHPLALTPMEMAVLLLAQHSIAATGMLGSPFAHLGKQLIAKIKSSLPVDLKNRLDSLSAVFGTASISAKDYSGYANTIDKLIQAVLDSRSIRIDYYSINRDSRSERVLDPYAVYYDPDGATLKLMAYCHNRRAVIPFSIDHIRDIKILEEHFVRPDNFQLHEFLVQNCFNGIHGPAITVRLRARGITARVFAERSFHPSQKTLERSKGTDEFTTIEMTVASGRGLVRFILSWLPDIEVLEPTELRQEITELLQQSLESFKKICNQQ